MSNPYDLNVMHLNVCSLMNKQVDLKEVLNNLQNEKLTIDIILLCETYLNECIQKMINMLGYNMIKKKQENDKKWQGCYPT